MGWMSLLPWGTKAEKVLETINGITLTRADIIKFGDTVRDYSAIHRDPAAAAEFGFRDTPVIGVHLAAIGGRLSRDLMTVIQTPESNYAFTGQCVTFRDPVYPEEQIAWNPPECEVDGDTTRYRLIVPNPNVPGQPRVEMVSEFSRSYPEFKQPDPQKLVFTEDITISPPKAYYECLREEPSKSVDFCQGVAYVPSTLLSLAARLNQIGTTQIGGKNREMDSKAHGELKTGDARIDIYEEKMRPLKGDVYYTFYGVLSQAGVPIISSRVKTLTNGAFADLYAAKKQELVHA